MANILKGRRLAVPALWGTLQRTRTTDCGGKAEIPPQGREPGPRPDVSLGPCARSWLGIAGPSYSDDGFSDARLLASTSSTSWMMIQIFPTTSMRDHVSELHQDAFAQPKEPASYWVGMTSKAASVSLLQIGSGLFSNPAARASSISAR